MPVMIKKGGRTKLQTIENIEMLAKIPYINIGALQSSWGCNITEMHDECLVTQCYLE